jgi:carbamoyltransferase
MCNSVRGLTDKLSTSDLCLAGGVALNCKANGEVRKECEVKDLYIFPVANDAGGAVGAALAMASELGELRESKCEHTYWGPKFSNEQIEQLLKERKLKYEHYANIEAVCAERLATGKVVGWFQGKMEMGPRALGNRSILADPTKIEMKDIVNERVKKRESWRPFCPSLLVEAEDEYLVNACDAPFMILSFDVPPKKIKEIPAVVHVDGTTRPQTVRKEINERYWKLIKTFEGISGVPVILNTSFNLAGEPIVCTPSDALRSFYDSGMDCLALGNSLIEK